MNNKIKWKVTVITDIIFVWDKWTAKKDIMLSIRDTSTAKNPEWQSMAISLFGINLEMNISPWDYIEFTPIFKARQYNDKFYNSIIWNDLNIISWDDMPF